MRRKVFKYIFAIIIIFAVIITSGIMVTTKKDIAPTVTIGHAVSDENGNLFGGEAGDQSGEEVFLRGWYSGWSVVLRAKDSKKAEIIASVSEKACANDKIGYDQYERTTFYEQAKKHYWNVENINEACETDCSALVAVCVNAAGIEISKDTFTGNLEKNLMATGEFEAFTDDSYTENTQLLQRGDILLKKGHTAVVINTEKNG